MPLENQIRPEHALLAQYGVALSHIAWMKASLGACTVDTVRCTRPDRHAGHQVPTTQLMRNTPVEARQVDVEKQRAKHCVNLILMVVEGGVKY
jgi:hypothetical protein